MRSSSRSAAASDSLTVAQPIAAVISGTQGAALRGHPLAVSRVSSSRQPCSSSRQRCENEHETGPYTFDGFAIEVGTFFSFFHEGVW